MGRRRPGTLIAIEVDILEAGLALRRAEVAEFHGFELARHLADGAEGRRLTAHGTLYKALGRLEDRELLTSSWEDPDVAVDAGRPRRRLYRVTGAGERALAAWRREHPASAGPLRPGLAGGS